MDIKIKCRLKAYTKGKDVSVLEHQLSLLEERVYLLEQEVLKKTDEIILSPNIGEE